MAMRDLLFPGEGRGPERRRGWIPAFAGKRLLAAVIGVSALFGAGQVSAAEKDAPVARDYSLVRAAAAARTSE